MTHVSVILAIGAALLPGVLAAQTTSGVPTVLTTRILAIGTLTAPLSPEEMKIVMPKEVRATVELYLNGKIDQWWFRQDGNGVVFLLNVTSIEEADSMLEKLPLGVAKRMKFQLMPLGPLNPLHILLHDQAAKQSGEGTSGSGANKP
jgi:hypothetical protein